MKKTVYWAGLGVLISGLMGCSTSEWESEWERYQLFPDAYTYDVPFDSIYHYGYNQGCETALSLLGVTDTEYQKDEALENSDTHYDQGWEDGKQACQQGVRALMPTSKIIPGPITPDDNGYADGML
ncbi:hypothetical protein JCM19237_5227 [Photobacterium aphoticum]|uniref:Lipoprotein n=1 Tax=Photobacterium aphoticum TaxID=754436 RepID=A0A090QKI7_9GAMM|nr:hypothetical protein JCM19237_5227 [Photobacterium aphoticum]